MIYMAIVIILNLFNRLHVNRLAMVMVMTMLCDDTENVLLQKTETGAEIMWRMDDGTISKTYPIRSLEGEIMLDDIPVIVLRKGFMDKPLLLIYPGNKEKIKKAEFQEKRK